MGGGLLRRDKEKEKVEFEFALGLLGWATWKPTEPREGAAAHEVAAGVFQNRDVMIINPTT